MSNERLKAALDKENYDKLKDECLHKTEVSKEKQDERLKCMLEIVEDYGSFKLNHNNIDIVNNDKLENTINRIDNYQKTVEIIENIRKKK